jgi:Family of unknown function (DUF6481)
MSSYKPPSFQERAILKAKAKEAALAKLRARPVVDPAIMAERRAAAEVREAEQIKASQERAAARALAKAAKKEQSVKAVTAVMASETEQKAMRDARYAARKKRKGR